MTCGIYCRLSKEDAGRTQESESIQNQKTLLLHHAVQQGWEVYNIYCDEDYSGADARRPAFNRMLEDARAGRFGILLCKSQSRFTRDMEVVERYIHGLFPLWGIRFIALVDGIDTDQKGNKKARQINGLVNEWYLEDLSENVRAVLDQKRREGKHIGSFAPYGYRKEAQDNNRLAVDEEAAAVVRQIFRLYLNGLGTNAVAQWLNRQGIPNPAAYKRKQGLQYRNGEPGSHVGTQWSAATVSRILKNEVYIGNLIQGVKRKAGYKSNKLLSVPKEQWFRSEGTHPPIIERELFQAVQARISGKGRSGKGGVPHALAGKVRCGTCGSTMQRLSHRYKSVKRAYLQCRLYAATRSQPRCSGHTLRLDWLTGAVEQRIQELLHGYYQLSQDLLDGAQDDYSKDLEKQMAAALERRERTAAALRELYLDKAGGIITPEQFAELKEGIETERQGARRQLEQLTERQHVLSAQGKQERWEGLEQWLKQPKLTRQLAEQLIDSIEVQEKDREAGEQRIVIHWRI